MKLDAKSSNAEVEAQMVRFWVAAGCLLLVVTWLVLLFGGIFVGWKLLAHFSLL